MDLRSRLLALTGMKSVRWDAPPPSGVICLFCKTRSRRNCSSSDMSLISSRNRMPPAACWIRPFGAGFAGAGKGLGLIAEQCGLDQGFGQGSAIDGYEGLAGANRLGVQMAGKHFLAGASLAGNEQQGFGVDQPDSLRQICTYLGVRIGPVSGVRDFRIPAIAAADVGRGWTRLATKRSSAWLRSSQRPAFNPAMSKISSRLAWRRTIAAAWPANSRLPAVSSARPLALVKMTTESVNLASVHSETSLDRESRYRDSFYSFRVRNSAAVMALARMAPPESRPCSVQRCQERRMGAATRPSGSE